MTALQDIDTPALLVDADALERNVARIAETCRASGVGWRPHMKSHKTVEIARLELDHGAIGVTCAKLGEAEVMAAAGLSDIVVANQVVGLQKMARLRALLERADVIVCVDNPVHLEMLEAALSGTALRLRVLIEVNVGMNRAGVLPEAVLPLARLVGWYRHLSFAGVLTWESHALATRTPQDKERVVRDAIARLVASVEECRTAGLPVDIVSCGGTGTFPYCIRQPGITEVQIGGGIFGDLQYSQNYGVEFEPALSVLATVISRPTPTRLVLDAGRKAISGDAAQPIAMALPGVRSLRLSAEHTTIELGEPADLPRIGDHVALAVGYSDTTVHLHEEMVAVRDGVPFAAWPIAARGRIR